MDVSISLSRMEEPPRPGVSNEVHDRQGIIGLGTVIDGIFRIEVVLLPAVTVNKIVVGVEDKVGASKDVELQRQISRRRETSRFPSFVDVLVPRIQRR